MVGEKTSAKIATDMTNDFVIDVWESVQGRPKRGSWKMWRQPHGTREVCYFPTRRLARHYVIRHGLNFASKVRVRNIVTNETWDVS
jgi:hypothetical protein